MSRSVAGWVWVAGQVVVLGALILLPGRDDWPTPSWIQAVASVLFFGGLIVMGIAALGLGSALTPTPVPVSHGSLKTGGLYRFVRHPIYTCVLALVIAMTLRSGSWIKLAIAVATLFFFHRKARWEEQQLRAHYPGYDAYAAKTPRFVPRLFRSAPTK